MQLMGPLCIGVNCPKGGTNICPVLGTRRWQRRGRNSSLFLHTSGKRGRSAQKQKLVLDVITLIFPEMPPKACWWRHQHSLSRIITSSNLSFEALKSRPVSFQDMGTEEMWLHLGILTRVRMMVTLRWDQTKARMCHSLWVSELTWTKSYLGTGECVLHCCCLGILGLPKPWLCDAIVEVAGMSWTKHNAEAHRDRDTWMSAGLPGGLFHPDKSCRFILSHTGPVTVEWILWPVQAE